MVGTTKWDERFAASRARIEERQAPPAQEESAGNEAENGSGEKEVVDEVATPVADDTRDEMDIATEPQRGQKRAAPETGEEGGARSPSTRTMASW